ncbi:MAG: anaerobic ribonucleoside triphosphate reductase [bacterium]|nr:anaerobic ribonucleoside triphosphate reductase [bacterium]
MLKVENELENLKVIKRNGKRVSFNEDKIRIAIKKGFDSIESDEEVNESTNTKYHAEDIINVYNAVIDTITQRHSGQKTIGIEVIQNIIEEQLMNLNYKDVYEKYSNYREKRNNSREILNKRMLGLVKVAENLGFKDSGEENLKRENANVDGDTAMGTMLQFGSSFSKEFAKSYLIKDSYAEAHDMGYIHIHDMDFIPMGTTTCLQIDLNDLFKDGFSTGHGHLRTPNDILSYTALAAIAIQANQNDQHGGQSIPAFDYFMAKGVLKTFKKQFKQLIYDFLDIEGFVSFVKIDDIMKEIDKINSIDFDLCIFDRFTKNNDVIYRIFKKAYSKAIDKTDRTTYQAMEAFIHNLNTMHSRAGAQVPFSSINFGTDTSCEGRMVVKNYLLAADSGLGHGETPIFPISIFKVKEGINYNKEDPNYDLFELACKVSAKRLFPNFSFIDAPFNLALYREGDYNTEIAYMGCRTRVANNVADPNKAIFPNRGNLSFTSINLVRLGIKHGIVNGSKIDLDSFYKELEDMLILVKNQLLERYAIQCNKRVKNFPFLMGQGLWLDSKGLKPNDKVKRVLKHGTLSIGFIGLAECLKALTGKHHGESNKSQELGLEIIKFMRDKCDEFAKEEKLNFTLLATPAEGLSGRFTSIDKGLYGEIAGITDRNYYTNSFHVPVYYNITATKKIKLEAPYHALTNAGHITYIELDGDACENLEAFKKVVRVMKESNIGYGAINHPVDRDPVCGFNGVIGDTCPGCNRTEADGVLFERIRRITGYLVGTVDRFNNSKKDEEKDRVKHSE